MTRSSDYRHVFAQPRKYVSRNITILARGNGGPTPRLGLIISKRNVKAAVGRNRIKRIARESFRHHQAQLPALDIIVMARRGLGELPNHEVFAALAKHWAQLAQWQDS